MNREKRREPTMKKRMLSLLLALGMGLSLAACGETETTDVPSKAPAGDGS